jgi:hypothetical protein
MQSRGSECRRTLLKKMKISQKLTRLPCASEASSGKNTARRAVVATHVCAKILQVPPAFANPCAILTVWGPIEEQLRWKVSIVVKRAFGTSRADRCLVVIVRHSPGLYRMQTEEPLCIVDVL